MVPVRARVPVRPVVRSARDYHGGYGLAGAVWALWTPKLTHKPECSPVNAYLPELVVDNGRDGCLGLVGHAGSTFWKREPVYQVKLQPTPFIKPSVRPAFAGGRRPRGLLGAWAGFGLGRLLESLGRVSATWL
jgi:hypothetical protein